MDEKFAILHEISKNPNTSNRKLAKLTSKAVGTVNARIHELLDEEYITFQREGARTFHYEITRKGQLHYSELLHIYTNQAIALVDDARANTRRVIHEKLEEGVRRFYLYGTRDALYRIAKMTLIELSLDQKITYSDLDDLAGIQTEEDHVVLIWETKNTGCCRNAANILL